MMKEALEELKIHMSLFFAKNLHSGAIPAHEAMSFLKQYGYRRPEILGTAIPMSATTPAESSPHAPPFRVAAIIELEKVGSKKTEDCFIGPEWMSNAEFVARAPANQRRMGACTVSVLSPSRDWTLGNILAVISRGMDTCTRMEQFSRYTMTASQIEKLIEKTEAGERTDMMRTGCHGNFWLMETGDKENPIILAAVSRHEQWNAFIPQNKRPLPASTRILIRDFDASVL